MSRRAKATGRKVRFGLNPFVALGASAEAAFDSTIAQIKRYERDADTRKIERRMIPATRTGCIGTDEAILRQMRRYEEMGIELLLLKLVPTVDNVRLIGRDVIAGFRKPELQTA
jgi:alkanesulfonate monooxygenase SsuD/methylene tetrahydromethanopterin reductase-like flavin-dependent oxidoreductase (luciferase family)